MLGGEQDCYGGCTDAGQAFYGLMDEASSCHTLLCHALLQKAVVTCSLRRPGDLCDPWCSLSSASGLG